jgi:hypothetical protein
MAHSRIRGSAHGPVILPIQEESGTESAAMCYEINAFWEHFDSNLLEARGIEITGGVVFTPEPCPPPGIFYPPQSRQPKTH